MKNFLFFFLFIVFACIFSKNAYAQTLIDGGVIPESFDNSNAPVPTPAQAIHGIFSGKNYQIKVGFEDSDSEAPFNLSVSENLIDYGIISATDPVIRTNSLTVSSPYEPGYTIQEFENHSLKQSSSSVFIPDTTCDNGLCTESIAQPWSGTLTYGFGYRCDKNSSLNACLSDFADDTSYKQFAQTDEPGIITVSKHNSSVKISYKINIAGSQAPQFNNNKITLIPVPNF